MKIRLATEADLAAIRDIYNHYVETSTCTFQLDPDTEADRLAWFREHGERHPATVVELDGEVVGWASLSPWKSRAGYRFSVEGSVYVRAGLHRRGLGRALLVDLIERARSLGYHVLMGGACSEVPESIALQKAVGFVEVAHLREVGFKFGRWLDVVYLQLILNGR